jgi:hypothetical protein
MKTALSLILVSAALAACAPPPAPGTGPQAAARSPRQCFYASSVNNFQEVGDEAVNVRVGANQIWRLDFLGRCPGIEWSSSGIGLQQRGGGGAICNGFDVDVITTGGTGLPRCPVRSVRRLTDVEIAALPDRQKP